MIKVKSGETVNMYVKNDLSDSTSVHWHGLEVNGPEDGGPHQVIDQGTLWEPSFMIDQPASTLWFHPHVIGTTAIQVYYGLAGLIIVEDEFSDALNIPKDYGVNDIPLIIQDRSFNSDGSFNYTTNMMNGVVGDKILVNGAITPTLKVIKSPLMVDFSKNLMLIRCFLYHQVKGQKSLLIFQNTRSVTWLIFRVVINL